MMQQNAAFQKRLTHVVHQWSEKPQYPSDDMETVRLKSKFLLLVLAPTEGER